MGAFFVYIVKSAVCLAVFYLFYRLLLSKETFHRFNRIALLGILVLSCVIPFIEVTMKEPIEMSQQFMTLEEMLLMADMETLAAWKEKKIKVTGKVRDKADNSPIVGASIIVDGTTNGTISDLDGNFVLEMNEGGKLRFSYINYATKVLPVPADTKGLIVLMEKDDSGTKVNQVDEMVVVGYAPVAADDPGSQVFQVVEEMPEYPGGMGECLKFLGKNIKYPIESQKAGVQGKVIVQFVVEKDGNIANPKVVRSIDPNLDGEAIRVISIMPKWKPGMQKGEPVRVQYTVPVTFKLTGNDKSGLKTFNLDAIPADKRPLIMVDGQKLPQEIVNLIDPNKIENISVLKDEQSTSKYGVEGKNGVVLITTKKK